MSDRKVTILIIAIFVTILVFTACIIIRTTDISLRGNKRFEQEVIPENVEVIKGIVDSPAVKIHIESAEEFLAKIAELNADVVYKSSTDISAWYYVFTDNYQIAYFFQPHFDSITGEMVN